MEAIKMEGFIRTSRSLFRDILKNKEGEDVILEFLKESLKECCSEFEENCLIENLAEEYKEHLKELAAA